MSLTWEVSSSTMQCMGTGCDIHFSVSLLHTTTLLQSLQKLYAEREDLVGKEENLKDYTSRSKSGLFKDSRNGREELKYSGQD